jgi:hypothetical protein
MKRILVIIAAAGLFTAAPAFAGIDVVVQLGTPAPVFVAPAPVYVTPAVYRHGEPRWHERHHRFEHRDFRGHHDFREHHGHRDYRDRH